MFKPFSQSCENNKHPILTQLQTIFSPVHSVLEIGTGTGQHAVFFAQHLPHLIWHTSDLVNKHEGIQMYLTESPLSNLRKPLTFAIGQDNWPIITEGVFTANTTHIMSKELANRMMKLVAKNLPSGGIFCQYGPFNYQGNYTSDSNQNFDIWLTNRGHGGIRSIEELKRWANKDVLYLDEQILMPANNFLLVWRKR